MKKIKRFLINLFFPKKCVICSSFGSWLCPKCQKKVQKIKTPFCPKCKKITSFGQYCPRCRRTKTIRGVIAAGYYQGVLKETIHSFKYQKIKELRKYLFELISDRLSEGFPAGEFILVPVPLNKIKLYHRGFNQSEEIAKEIEKNYGYKLVNCLDRIKNTKSQIGLSQKERLINVQNCFAIKSGFDIRNKNIFLIDDVVTSGATVESAAKVLKQSGAKKIWVISLAIA